MQPTLHRTRTFVREARKTTPYVCINYSTGHIEMKGVSHAENVFTFFNPIYEAIRYFAIFPSTQIVADFSFEYFNTSSARSIFMILKEMKELQKRGRQLTINWHYEEGDDDMQETGEDFEELIGLKFNYIEVED